MAIYRFIPILMTSIVVLGILNGCPAGTIHDHSRPHGHQNMTVDLAPNGDSLVFNSTGKGGRDLYVLRLSDLSVTRLAETDEYELCPAFSPDGKKIAYAAGLPGDKADHIFTIRIDGTEKQQLTYTNANDTAPAYSPDGRMITFARDKSYVWGGMSANWDNGGVICVVNSDGTDERQLTPDNEFAFSPCFSKNGNDIIYSTQSGLFSVPVTMDAPATRLGPTRMHLAICSDGETVLFADGKFSPDHEIFVSHFDGSQRRQITESHNGRFHPVVAKNGNFVFYLMEEWPNGFTDDPKRSIWTVTLEGEDQKQLTDLFLFDDPLNWQPEDSL